MELLHTPSLFSRFTTQHRCYCLFMLKSKLRFTPKFQTFFHIFHILQVLTLIFRPEENYNLPWNYSSLSSFWTAISFATRIDYLALYFNFLHVWVVFLVIMLGYLFTKILLISKVEFIELTPILPNHALGSNLLRKYILEYHIYSSHFLFSIQPMSTLHAFLSMPIALQDEIESTTTIAITSINLLIYLLLYLEDTIFLQKLSWVSYDYTEVIASASFVMTFRLMFVVVNFVVAYTQFDENYLVYTIVLVIIGYYQLYVFARKLPYGSITRNFFKGIEGLVLFWGGFAMLLAKLNGYVERDSYYGTLIFFVPIGFMIYLYKEYIHYRYNILLHTRLFLTPTQVFHILLAQSNPTLKVDIDFSYDELRYLIETGNMLEPKNLMYSIWLVYYMTLQEKIMPAKVLISQLMKHKSIKYSIYIDQAREDYYESLNQIEFEREALEYIFYISKFQELVEADKRSADYLLNLYNDLLSLHRDSRSLSRDMTHFYKSVQHTKNLYNYMISVFGKSPNMYEMYAGFLDVIENSHDAKDELMKAKKYREEIMKKEEAKEMEIIFFDNRNLILIISAESNNLGTILSFNNPPEFGFKESELEGEPISVIFPNMIISSYLNQLHSIHNIWSDSNLQVSEQCHILKDGYILPVIIRNNLINLSSGELAVILAIKPKAHSHELAILDEEGKYIVCYVRFM